MAEHSTIEWTDATWNPITGCSVVSPGCTNCYAMSLAGTRLKHHASRKGLTRPSKAGPVWNGEVRLNEASLTDPIRWKRPRKIFVCAHGDLFHESVPDAWIDMVFGVMASALRHTFQVLTKRPARMREYLLGLQREAPERLRHYIDVTMAPGRAARQALDPPMSEPAPPTPELRALYDRATAALRARSFLLDDNKTSGVNLPEYHWRQWPLPNVWLGVSAEDQRRADERVPDLLATPAAVRFVSAEPLLGPIDFMTISRPSPFGSMSALPCGEEGQGASLDWIIVGGESGPGARPMHPAWARSIRDQCAAAGVAFHFKQHGAWAPSPSMVDGLGVGGIVLWPNGDQGYGDEDRCGGRGVAMVRVGKKAAGRLLDGEEHNGMPPSECRHQRSGDLRDGGKV